MDLLQVEVLYNREQIEEKVAEIGRQISEDYRGHELLVVGILKGAFVFMAMYPVTGFLLHPRARCGSKRIWNTPSRVAMS